MHRLQTLRSEPFEGGKIHLVRIPSEIGAPAWLVQAQIELDGKRVFVRMVEDRRTKHEAGTVGLVVSPVY